MREAYSEAGLWALVFRLMTQWLMALNLLQAYDWIPSMRLDHLAGRRSEIDAINGMVSVLGREVGIATLYDSMVAVCGREAHFS